jgi:asparagine synthase (glutamine-hydrolysing)
LLPRLNGIFALALADTRRRVTLLARDPAGVKPLYIGIDGDSTWWASELGAARRAGLASSEVSRDALKLFVLFRYVPAPDAILDRAWKIPPGHFVVLDSGTAGQTPKFRSFQTTIRSSAEPRGEEEWRTALIGTLEDAVARQLMSDVPVGSLLSGGVDSSLITLLMDRHLPYHPQAFGIGFRSHGARSESIAGACAAQMLGVPYTSTEVEDAEYLAAWPAAFASTSEPVGNSGGLLVHLLCRAVGRTHKVVLSGQGADEPLGGYPRHMAERLHRLGRRAPGVSAWIAERLLGSGAGERLGRVLHASNRIDRYLEILALSKPELADRWVPGGTPARELGRAALARWVPDVESGDPLNDLLRVDARLSLADDLLNIADHHSMRASVELRVPFLDLEFLDLAERMPSRYKVSSVGERKWLYRQAAARTLPPDLSKPLQGLRARLGRKVGFTTPLERWFVGDQAPLGGTRRWMEPLVQRGLFSQSAVSTFVTEAERQPGKRQRELLAFYALSRWMETAE